MRAHGLSAITSITAQTLQQALAIRTVAPSIVAAQIDAAFGGFAVRAVKIGMLGSGAIAACVAERLSAHGARAVVVDPVLASSSGTSLFSDRSLASLRRLLALADVLTPNVPEAEILLGRRVRGPRDLTAAAHDLLATGARAGLLKGGHLRGASVHDVLVSAQGSVRTFEHVRVAGRARGTGCALASATAAGLARGLTVIEAVAGAERYLQDALRRSYRMGRSERRVLGAVWDGSGPQTPDAGA